MEGAAIPEIAGRVRIAGQIVWATRFKEVATTTTQRCSGWPRAAVAADRSRPQPIPISRTSRWACAKVRSTGSGSAPAYRGTAYVVFDKLALEKFGNRLPQLTFEVFRRVSSTAGDSLETIVRGP